MKQKEFHTNMALISWQCSPISNCTYSTFLTNIFLLYYGILSNNQFKYTNVISLGLPIVYKYIINSQNI